MRPSAPSPPTAPAWTRTSCRPVTSAVPAPAVASPSSSASTRSRPAASRSGARASPSSAASAPSRIDTAAKSSHRAATSPVATAAGPAAPVALAGTGAATPTPNAKVPLVGCRSSSATVRQSTRYTSGRSDGSSAVTASPPAATSRSVATGPVLAPTTVTVLRRVATSLVELQADRSRRPGERGTGRRLRLNQAGVGRRRCGRGQRRQDDPGQGRAAAATTRRTPGNRAHCTRTCGRRASPSTTVTSDPR